MLCHVPYVTLSPGPPKEEADLVSMVSPPHPGLDSCLQQIHQRGGDHVSGSWAHVGHAGISN